jgi:hypothetical protein
VNACNEFETYFGPCRRAAQPRRLDFGTELGGRAIAWRRGRSGWGAVVGLLLLVLAIIFTGSTFGLENVLIGGVVGSFVCFILGFCFPSHARRLFVYVLEYF